MKTIEEQVILITGSTDGIGKIVATRLAQQGATVILHGRQGEKASKAVTELRKTTRNQKVQFVVADFSSLDAVRSLGEEVVNRFPVIDVLINNAGAGFADPQFTFDGYETRMVVNYLAPYVFTETVLPSLRRAGAARIVNVSSAGQQDLDFSDMMQEKAFDGVRAYRRSKLALVMYTIDLAKRLAPDNITVNCLHPGTYLDTNMVRNAKIKPHGKAETGAEAEIWLAESPELNGVSGEYFDGKEKSRALAQAYDEQARKKLREWSAGFLDAEMQKG
jgi:NAD(P)-dependent dehydrogenase (short-subunit alcohol dehydrogenase family)